MISRFGNLLAALALPATASAAAQELNNLELHNGTDLVFYYNDPSIGGPPGAPDLDGDWWWKVFPGAVLNHPLGAMEITGFVFEIYDGDWITTPDPPTNDIVFAPGIPSVLNPGNIEPDLASPLAVLLPSFALGLADPCAIPGDPLGCGGPCPPPGSIAGYVVDVALATPVPGTGIPIAADGIASWTWSTFIPGGMPFLTPPLGPCGLGDFVFQGSHSSPALGGMGEFGPDVLGTGYSVYGGFHVGGTGIGVLVAEPVAEVYTGELEFRELVSRTTVDVGLGVDAGLASLNPPSGGGVNTIGTRYSAAAQVGELGFFFGSFFPLLPAPGLPIFDILILIPIGDPLAGILAGIWAGPILPVPNGGVPFDDGVLDAPQIPLIPAAVGFPLSVQGFNLDLVTLDFDYGQVATVVVFP